MKASNYSSLIVWFEDWKFHKTNCCLPRMPLLVDGEAEVSRFHCFADFAKKYPHFKKLADEFCQKPTQKIGEKGSLYIMQGEYATVAKNDENVTVMGSEDATTCHIVVLQHTGSGVTSLGHFDGNDTQTGIRNMISSVKSTSNANGGNILLHLFGGFRDDRGTSERLTTSIINAIQNQDEAVHLISACITGFNDDLNNGLHKPRVYGVGVTVQDGDIFPVTFQVKTPDEYIRHARIFTGFGKMTEIYNSSYKELRVMPYEYKKKTIIPYISHFLDASDEEILQHLSTSPHCEPPDFVANTRATLNHILTHPNPLITVFSGGRARVYKRQPGIDSWTSVES